MGDRTYCEIRVNKYYYEQLKNSLTEDDPKLEETYEDMDEEDGDTIRMYDCEANYGQMEQLESLLHDRKIEYDKRWEAGGDYPSGEEYARKVNGEYSIQEISDGGIAVLEELKLVLTETDPVKREALINKRIKELEPFEVTPLTMPQSIDFIKNA